MKRKEATKEIFDVVNLEDQIIGQEERVLVHQKGLIHRAIHVFVRNEKNLWILQLRSQYKDTEPLSWTTSCSGHVDAGEGYLDAAVRECYEELGISTKHEELIELLHLSPCRETGNEFVRVYFTSSRIRPIADGNEIKSITCLSVKEISKLLKQRTLKFSLSFQHIFPLVEKKLKKII